MPCSKYFGIDTKLQIYNQEIDIFLRFAKEFIVIGQVTIGIAMACIFPWSAEIALGFGCFLAWLDRLRGNEVISACFPDYHCALIRL